jgi:hypothetical protein
MNGRMRIRPMIAGRRRFERNRIMGPRAREQGAAYPASTP